MDKDKVAEILVEIGVLLELKGENPFKTRAYANAARAWSVYYLYDDDDKPEGWGGNEGTDDNGARFVGNCAVDGPCFGLAKSPYRAQGQNRKYGN